MKPLIYKGYLGSVECSIEDDCLHGKILHVNDLVTFEASTPSELQKAFEESVEDYLATCVQLGKEADKSYKGTFNVRVRPELHRGVATSATLQDISLNEWVAKAIAEKLDGSAEVHHHHESHIHIEATVTEQIDFAALNRGGAYSVKETSNA